MFNGLFSIVGSRFGQILVIVLVSTMVVLYGVVLTKDKLLARKEAEIEQVKRESAEQEANRQIAMIKAQEESKKRVQDVQKRIDEAAKVTTHDNSTLQKPNIGERAHIWVLIIALFGLTACAPKTVTEYITIQEPMPEIHIIAAPERNLPLPIRIGEDSYSFTWEELLQVRGYIFSLENIVQGYAEQVQEYNNFRNEKSP